MTRTPFVVGNWKMFHGGASGCELADAVCQATIGLTGVELAVAPPFTGLAAVAEVLRDRGVAVAAQNCHPGSTGAFTGEVSAPMLAECGCSWVIVGHSERRQLFGETDAAVAEKVAAVFAAGLRPILCVGETLPEREAGRTLEVVSRQLEACVQALVEHPGGVVAYEPVWAIGTGRVATPEQAQEVHAALRTRLETRSAGLGGRTRLLYGGSVKPENAAGLMSQPDIDGALVGGASLDARAFAAIAAAAAPLAQPQGSR